MGFEIFKPIDEEEQKRQTSLTTGMVGTARPSISTATLPGAINPQVASSMEREPEQKETFSSKVKRIGLQLPIGMAKGVSDLQKNLGVNLDPATNTLKQNRDIASFQPLITDSTLAGWQQGIGAKDTMPETMVRGVGEFIPSIALGGGLLKTLGLAKNAAATAEAVSSKIANPAGKAATKYAIKELPIIGTTWEMMEKPKPEEERIPIPLFTAEWLGGDLLLKGAGKGLGTAFSKLKAKPPETNFKLDDLPEWGGGKQELLALPPGSSDFTVSPSGQAWGRDLFMPPARIPSRSYEPDLLQQRLFQSADESGIPRSDIGDPAYIAQLKKQYNDMVADEVRRMKESLGGVVRYRPGEDGPSLRASQNPLWYQQFWKKYGRKPREGEWRDMAIDRLLMGADEMPPDEAFHRVVSELSRGQKLPEEWHALQSTARELAMEGDDSVTALLDEIAKEQKKIEPFGIFKDLDRLTEIENAARQRMKDRANFRAKYKNVIGIAPQNPMDEVKDLVIIGAVKLAKKGITAQQWAAEMMKEFGSTVKDLEKNLGYIYHRANELITNGISTIKYHGQTFDVTLDDVVARGGKAAAKGAPANWNHVVSKTDRDKISIKGALNAAYRMTVDDLYRLKQVDPEAYQRALNSRHSSGTTLFIVNKGLVDTAGNVIGPSFKSITQKVPKGRELDFSNYLIYRHAPSWLNQGRKVFPEWEGITPEVAMQRAATYEAQNPEFKQIADELVKFYQDFMEKWAVEGGLIDRGLWENLKKQYPNYVPLMRKMEDVEIGAQGVKKGFVNQPSPIKKAEGSQREIFDPLESMLEQIDRTVRAQRRNEVAAKLYQELRAGDDLKCLIEIVPEKGDAFEDIIARDGIEGFVKWLEEPFEDMVARKNAKLDRPNIVRARINGQTVHMKVNDKPLLDALTSLGPQATGGIIEAARQVTRVMKVLTTGANVFFASRNIVRDIPTSYIFSKTLSNIPGVREVQFATDLLDSMARIITGGRYDPGGHYKTYQALGGGSHSSAIASDRNLLGEAKAKALPGYFDINHPVRSVVRGAQGIGRGIEAFTNAVETVPRLPEYIRTAKQGGDTVAARQAGLYNAQDVTVNFSKRGTASHQADAIIPYFNASIQGLDKMGREIVNNPFHLALRGITAITIPTIGLYMINRDDPNYKKLSSFIKDNYYCFPKGDGTFIKIAKPRELGQVFGSLVERSLARWADGDPDGYRGFQEAWFTNFIPPTRTIAAPLIDIGKNQTLTGAPIVPGYMENLSPEMQYDETTSIPAIAVGQALGVSPKKIDYAVRSYTGFLGELGIPALSQGSGQTALQRIVEAIQKPYHADPVYSNDLMRRFYDEKTKLDNAAADYKVSKIKSAYYNAAKRKKFNAVANDISEINKKIRKINANPNISYEQKKAQTRELKDKANRLAEKALQKR